MVKSCCEKMQSLVWSETGFGCLAGFSKTFFKVKDINKLNLKILVPKSAF